jgi:alkylation response protein AidB-like acyl-CoA dehydrogenase
MLFDCIKNLLAQAKIPKERNKMDFDITDEQKIFREEIRQFLDKEVTPEILEESELGMGYGSHSWELIRKLGSRKWWAPSFPKEYGGLGLTRIYRYIVLYELNYRNALEVIPGMGAVGVDMAGPIILHYGSEELKSEFLPRIARGEIDLALGYTEPDVGSDLSRISMQAVESGDDYIISGQKTFNTGCHFSQYHWLAVRTDPDAPRHKGISLFVVDLKTPGITINPLWEMSDMRTNEVFYDDVRVPKKYLVGEKNAGWYYMASALDLERLLTVGSIESLFEEIVSYVKSATKNGIPLSKDVLVRQELAEIALEISVARNLVHRVVWMQDKGTIPVYETAVLKLFITELTQRLIKAGMSIAGSFGRVRKSSKHAVLKGKLDRGFRGSFLHSIGGGSSEVMKNIIAIRGLGLPRN